MLRNYLNQAARSLLTVLVGGLLGLELLVPSWAQAQQFPNGNRTLGEIQQTAASAAGKTSGKPKRPIPYPIEKMPDSTEEMEIIHHRSQLVVTRAPISRISIANPEIIDVVQYSPTEISIIGLNIGTTTLHVWFDKPGEPLIYLVEVIRDPTWDDRLRQDFGKLEKQLQILFPNSKVYLIPLEQRLVVKGQAANEQEAAFILQIVRSAYAREWGPGGPGGYGGYGGYGGGGYGGYGNNTDADNNDDDDEDDFIVNMLEVPGNHQVMLHVKIAEISRSDLRRLGVSMNYLLNNGRHAIGTALAAGAAGAGGGGAAGGIAAGATTLTGVFENGAATILVNWLAGNHTAKILAAPTLTVLSGHEASFLSGGEFPVPTIVGVQGAQGTSTAFRGYGTSLIVRPEVIDRDWIKMDITPEFSNIDLSQGGGGGVPSLNSRRVSTTVKLREGQTIVLGGLFGHTGSTNVSRIPYLGELPLIGPLFNSKNASYGENELLIMVTPELVRAMEPDEVPPLPGFYVTWPNDIELYHYSKTEGYPDQGVYQLSPYGWGPGYASEVGYRPFNPAPAQSPFGTGGGAVGGGMMGMGAMAGGYAGQQQPAAIYPGPPMPQAPAPQMAPSAGPYPSAPQGTMQPSPDPNMGALRNGPVQQVGYTVPAGANPRNWLPNWGRGSQAPTDNRNPATMSTNSTTPSIETGTDGRLGQNGQRPPQRPQQPRGRY